MSKEEMILADYLGVIFRRKFSILGVAVLGLLLTAMLTSKEQVIFKSRARLKIQRQINVTQMFDELLMSSGDPLENYMIEISGYEVVSNAAAALAYPDSPTMESIAALRAAISAERIAKTDLIDVFTTGQSPQEARRRCEAVLDAFVVKHDQALRKNAQEVLAHVQDSYNTLVQNLKKREAELLEKLGPYALSTRDSTEIAALRQRLAELYVQLQRLRLSGNFTEDYPEIVRLRTETAQLEALIQKEVADELNRQAQMAEYRRYRELIQKADEFFTPRLEEAKIAATKKGEIVLIIEPPSNGQPTGTGRLNKLIAGGLLSLMLGIVLAFVADHLDTSVRNIPEIERLFKLPVLGVVPHFSLEGVPTLLARHPVIRRLLNSAFFASFGVLWRAFRSVWLSKSKPSPTDASAAGASARPVASLIVPTMPRAPATEAYRTLRTNIQLHLQPDNNAVVFTSASPEEGKSTTITNLAVAFAQAGKRTLLVGANMRRPQMYRVFGLERERGLSDILVGDIKWKDAVKDYRDVALGEGGEGLATAPGMDNLFFITCGGPTIHPAEWLSQPLLGELVKEWKAAYDMVLMDSPPVLPVPDSLILSMTVRQTILIYQVGVTPRESVRRTIAAVQNTGAFLVGIVLNDVRASRVDDATFYQYCHYYGRKD